MKYFVRSPIYLVIFFLIFLSEIRCQTKSNIYNITGNWEVTDYQSCLSDNFQQNDADEEAAEAIDSCLGSQVTLNEKNIIFSPIDDCNLISCEILEFQKMSKEQKESDSVFSYSECFNILVRNKKTQNILNIIKEKYVSLEVIDTGCFCEFGDYTLKIIIFDENKIILFSGADITVLERIRTDN